MKLIIKFSKPYFWIIFFGSFFKGLSAAIDIALPLLLADIIRVGTTTGDLNLVIQRGVWMMALAFVCFLSTATAHYCSGRAQESVGLDMRKAVYAHKLTLSIRDLKDYTYSGLTTRIIYDIDNVSKFVSFFMRLICRNVVIAVGGLYMAIVIDEYIATLLIITMVVMIVLSAYIFKISGKWYRKVSEGIDTSSGIIREAITGIKTIKAFANQKKEENVFWEKISDIRTAQVRGGTIAGILPSTITLITNVALAGVFYISGHRVEGGFVDVLDLTAFVVYINMFVLAMVALSRIMVRFAKANSSARRVSELLDIRPSEKVIRKPAEQKEIAVSVKNLSFSFEEQKVLDNISFTLEKGKSLGVVGKTGSGKTTLVEMLTGIYDDYEGEIIINGKNIRHTPQKKLSSEIGIARQKFDIFTDTLEQNIILNKTFNEEMFNYAIQTAQIKNFVMKNGKQLNVRQSGTNLSGGQRQRINLARLFYNNPEIFVLDDVSSALDTKTNEKLNNALEQIRGEKTIICISNKITSVENCDCIIVLEEGRMTGFDTHENLMKNNECYRMMATTPSSEEDMINE